MTGPNLVPLPRQPSELPWPTVEWPQAEIDPRVDRARLARALDEALAQPEALGRTNAVVVVHRGAIVAARYGAERGGR